MRLLHPQVDPSRVYRPTDASQFHEVGHVLLYVAFSGGGTRAAAFAYGVLQELRDTSIVSAGKNVRLLDEVDALSGVSGGSFPAGYYGLFGDRIFEVICSDLDSFPVSTATAASSAVLGVLSPFTLSNYAGSCGFERPDWFVVKMAIPVPRLGRGPHVEEHLRSESR
jgi:hypothetical protein